jgi:ATP-dependent DNA helicase PIF1
MLQQTAFNILKMGYNVFLTGAAGAGKTFVLNQYINYLNQHGVVVAVTASTGIAATHLNGQTIHSWSGIGIKDKLTEQDLEHILDDQRIKKNYKYCKVLIIDEISMLHPEQLDMVDQIARGFLNPDYPFGGMQVVLCGDFFQLPPVAKGNTPVRFAYASNVWQESDFKICYLREQYRQNNDPLLEVLNTIRSGTAGENVKIYLRTRYKKEPELTNINTKPTVLYSRNISVDQLNERHLNEIKGEVESYEMTSKGFKKHVETLKKNCLAPEILRLKIGAQVMFVKNSQTGEYVNGTRGVITGFSKEDNWPLVKIADGSLICAKPVDWNLQDFDTIVATISQVPLRLAWAITIHKSQGMTLDAVETDLSDAFEAGMGYVALSRVRTLNGLKLLGLNDVAIQVNRNVLEKDHDFKSNSLEIEKFVNGLDEAQVTTEIKATLYSRFEALKNDSLIKKSRGKIKKSKIENTKIPTHDITKKLVEDKKTLDAIASERSLTVGTVLSHLEKLKGVNDLPDIHYLVDTIEKSEFDNILNAFKDSEDGKLAPIFEKFSGKYEFETLRLVRLFVQNWVAIQTNQ